MIRKPRFRVFVIGLCIVAVPGIVGFFLWKMSGPDARANEGSAVAALRSLYEAERRFRAEDSDHNGVADYWTGDVAGLRTFGLISRDLAEADAAPLKSAVIAPKPYSGYFFLALDRDEGVGVDYRKDTDGRSGKCHHEAMFGFCAYPAQPGKSGNRTYLMNETGLVIERDNGGRPCRRWPSDRAGAGDGSPGIPIDSGWRRTPDRR